MLSVYSLLSAQFMRPNLHRLLLRLANFFRRRHRFGEMVRSKEESRGELAFVALEQWGKDARFAVNSLARAPGFTLTVLLTLLAGIGVSGLCFPFLPPCSVFARTY